MKLIRATCCLFILLLSLATVMFIVVPTAAAKAPMHQRFTVTRHLDPIVTCSGFTIVGDFSIERDDITYFDASGTPITMVVHAHYQGTLTNSVTRSSLSDNGNRNITFDLLDNTSTITGLNLKAVAPGHGIVVMDAGSITMDAAGSITVEAGPHDLFNNTLQPLCAALTQG